MRAARMASLVVALAAAAWLAEAHVVEDVSAQILESTPPRYPPEAARAGISGTTVLVISISRTGTIENLVVEKSSGSRDLDAAAIDAANSWRFAPAIENGQPARGRMRVPVNFTMSDDDGPIRALAARLPSRWRVPAVTPDAKGTLPLYVEDPLPLEADSVAAILAMLQAKAKAIEAPNLPDGIALYDVESEGGRVYWEVYTDPVLHAPTVLRKRLTTDGTYGFFVTRVLCESKDADACARFLAYVDRPDRQRAVPLVAPAGDADAAKDAAPGR